jgi:hypothetical protein
LASPKPGGETVEAPRRPPAWPFAILKLTCCCKSASGRLRLRRYNRLVATDHRLMGTILPVGEARKKKVAQERDGSCATFVFEPPNGPTILPKPPRQATLASASCLS